MADVTMVLRDVPFGRNIFVNGREHR